MAMACMLNRQFEMEQHRCREVWEKETCNIVAEQVEWGLGKVGC